MREYLLMLYSVMQLFGIPLTGRGAIIKSQKLTLHIIAIALIAAIAAIATKTAAATFIDFILEQSTRQHGKKIDFKHASKVTMQKKQNNQVKETA